MSCMSTGKENSSDVNLHYEDHGSGNPGRSCDVACERLKFADLAAAPTAALNAERPHGECRRLQDASSS
jgi:hypothetical protein